MNEQSRTAQVVFRPRFCEFPHCLFVHVLVFFHVVRFHGLTRTVIYGASQNEQGTTASCVASSVLLDISREPRRRVGNNGAALSSSQENKVHSTSLESSRR